MAVIMTPRSISDQIILIRRCLRHVRESSEQWQMLCPATSPAFLVQKDTLMIDIMSLCPSVSLSCSDRKQQTVKSEKR